MEALQSCGKEKEEGNLLSLRVGGLDCEGAKEHENEPTRQATTSGGGEEVKMKKKKKKKKKAKASLEPRSTLGRESRALSLSLARTPQCLSLSLSCSETVPITRELSCSSSGIPQGEEKSVGSSPPAKLVQQAGPGPQPANSKDKAAEAARKRAFTKGEPRDIERLRGECPDQQDVWRRASSELPRGHKEKEKGRAFWHRERLPRRGILARSLSEENFRRHSHGCGVEDVELLAGLKNKRDKKRSKRPHDCVKFDRVMVRYYPREVSLGGCMLNPKHGPFLSLGWDWAHEDVHNLYAFERLREASRTADIHAMPSQERYALLLEYGLEPGQLEQLISEMRLKDKELTRRGGSSLHLPIHWPWKKAE